MQQIAASHVCNDPLISATTILSDRIAKSSIPTSPVGQIRCSGYQWIVSEHYSKLSVRFS